LVQALKSKHLTPFFHNNPRMLSMGKL
jgi:hypothetical protein